MKASDVREGTQPKREFTYTPSTRRIPVLATTSRIYRLLLQRINSHAPRPRGVVKGTSIWRNLSHSVHTSINRFGGGSSSPRCSYRCRVQWQPTPRIQRLRAPRPRAERAPDASTAFLSCLLLCPEPYAPEALTTSTPSKLCPPALDRRLRNDCGRIRHIRTRHSAIRSPP